jgi:hypothetical protein
MSNTLESRRSLRRLLSVAAMALALAVTSLGNLIPGSPLGDAEPAGAQAVPAGSPGVIRYFGRGAYDGIRAAVAATPRTCELSDDALTALVMAPIFKEVSMAETPEAVPSPMTLSRWDEWSGTASGSDNLDANYGLYAFRDPGTPYKRAYWTPGIGIFQYDEAGVGAGFTAADRMNVQHIAADVAAGMANRYCAAGGSAFNRRSAAWEPWSGLNGVAKSEALFLEMVGPGHPPFSTIGLVDGVDNMGGMRPRMCNVGGAALGCYFVDPAAAQGANWWATTNIDGGAAASGEAPLTAPFYVIVRNGYEERHWMAQDTGYSVNISARRVIGQNSRPRDGEPQSGLEWWKSSDLCDTSRPEMGCAPKPEPKPPAPRPRTQNRARAATADSLWTSFLGGSTEGRGDEGEADRKESDRPANSTFSFTRGLALVPPASR